MPTFKNIRVPVGKTGKTRLQRVQVLKSGKFKFVKNLINGKKKAKKAGNPKRSVKNTAKGKMFRTVSGAGAIEDVLFGAIGFRVLGGTPSALPMTRTLQGIAALALDRRGKRHAVDGILDLITLWLGGGFGNGGTRVMGGPGGVITALVSEIGAVTRLRPL